MRKSSHCTSWFPDIASVIEVGARQNNAKISPDSFIWSVILNQQALSLIGTKIWGIWVSEKHRNFISWFHEIWQKYHSFPPAKVCFGTVYELRIVKACYCVVLGVLCTDGLRHCCVEVLRCRGVPFATLTRRCVDLWGVQCVANVFGCGCVRKIRRLCWCVALMCWRLMQ